MRPPARTADISWSEAAAVGFGRLAGYDDVNDAEGLCRDPINAAAGDCSRANQGPAGSLSHMGRFKTEWLIVDWVASSCLAIHWRHLRRN